MSGHGWGGGERVQGGKWMDERLGKTTGAMREGGAEKSGNDAVDCSEMGSQRVGAGGDGGVDRNEEVTTGG